MFDYCFDMVPEIYNSLILNRNTGQKASEYVETSLQSHLQIKSNLISTKLLISETISKISF